VIFVKIGFFDSGIGGITVLNEAIRQLPNEDYIYFADTDNTPYGVKPKEEVKKYILNAIEFIYSQGVDAIVIACNTATSIAIEDLREKYNIPILGMEPAVKPAIEKNHSTNKRVLVTATPLTLKEEKLKNLIEKVGNEDLVDFLPLPRLVEFAERYCFEGIEIMNYLENEFAKFNLIEYGTIVLGCTHFPFYKNIIRELLPAEIDIIDGSEGTVRNLKRILSENKNRNSGGGHIVYYASGRLLQEPETLKQFDMLFNILSN
jgi:glutamate racemase